MPAVNINTSSKNNAANTKNALFVKCINVQKMSSEAKKNLVDKAEKLDIHEVAALWVSNIYQKEIVSIPVCKDGQIVSLSNTKKRWQIRFNDNVKITKIIITQGKLTTDDQRSALLVAYLNTLNHIQFHSYEQCYRQCQKVANSLYPQNPLKAQETLRRILCFVSIGLFNYANLTKLPIKPMAQPATSGSPYTYLGSSGSTNQTKKVAYDLKELFRTFELHSRRHVRTTTFFNQLLKSVVGAPFVELNPKQVLNQTTIQSTQVKSTTTQATVDLTQEETVTNSAKSMDLDSFNILASLASECLANNSELPSTPVQPICIDLNL